MNHGILDQISRKYLNADPLVRDTPPLLTGPSHALSVFRVTMYADNAQNATTQRPDRPHSSGRRSRLIARLSGSLLTPDRRSEIVLGSSSEPIQMQGRYETRPTPDRRDAGATKFSWQRRRGIGPGRGGFQTRPLFRRARIKNTGETPALREFRAEIPMVGATVGRPLHCGQEGS